MVSISAYAFTMHGVPQRAYPCMLALVLVLQCILFLVLYLWGLFFVGVLQEHFDYKAGKALKAENEI